MIDCPECGSVDVVTTIEFEEIPYGQNGEKVKCETPVRHCSTCQFNWLDREGTTASMIAVFKYEKSKGVTRTKFCNNREQELWERA
jgi:transposase-like protein